MTPPSSAHRGAIDNLATWCKGNHLVLNAVKAFTSERTQHHQHHQPTVRSSCVTPQWTLCSLSAFQMGAASSNFYSSIIESILTSSITIWYIAATAMDKGKMQCVIRFADKKKSGCNLPSLQDLCSSKTLKRAGKVAADPSYPGHTLFETLPAEKRLHSIKIRNSHHKNSFFPSATGILNKA